MKLHRDPELQAAFDDYNARYFGGELPSVPVQWSQIIHLGGMMGCIAGNKGHTRIMIASCLQPLTEDWRDTLLEEMIHLKLRCRGQSKGTPIPIPGYFGPRDPQAKFHHEGFYDEQWRVMLLRVADRQREQTV